MHQPVFIKGFHRTSHEENALFIGASGVKTFKGIYGKGFYMSRSLAYQMNRKMQSYGSYLVQCKVDVSGFICFDETLAQNVWGKNYSLKHQLNALKSNWSVKQQQVIKNLDYKLKSTWRNNKLRRGRDTWYTSEIAITAYTRLGLSKHVPGIVYTGSKDGPCVVAYRGSRVEPQRYGALETIFNAYKNMRSSAKTAKVREWVEYKNTLPNKFYLRLDRSKYHIKLTKDLRNIEKQAPCLKDKIQAFKNYIDSYLKIKSVAMIRPAILLEVWAILVTEMPALRRLSSYLVTKLTDNEYVLVGFGLKSLPGFSVMSKTSIVRGERVLRAEYDELLPRLKYQVPLPNLPAHLRNVLKKIQLAKIEVELRNFYTGINDELQTHLYILGDKKLPLSSQNYSTGSGLEVGLSVERILGVTAYARPYYTQRLDCPYNSPTTFKLNQVQVRSGTRQSMYDEFIANIYDLYHLKVGKAKLDYIRALIPTPKVLCQKVLTVIYALAELFKTHLKIRAKTWYKVWWEKFGKHIQVSQTFLQSLTTAKQ